MNLAMVPARVEEAKKRSARRFAEVRAEIVERLAQHDVHDQVLADELAADAVVRLSVSGR